MAKFLPVISSMFTAVSYDRESARLAIQFGEASFYHYDAVPPEVVLDVLFADSIGKAFNVLVKNGGYQYRQVPADEALG